MRAVETKSRLLALGDAAALNKAMYNMLLLLHWCTSGDVLLHACSQGNALDVEANCRGTSVYLVQRVIPMLPRLLCEKLCSLNSGDSRPSLHCYMTYDITDAVHLQLK